MTINLDTASPQEILEHVRQGAEITKGITDALSAHLDADWVIDLKEAEYLFELNHALGNREDESEIWPNFFSENISKLILFDLHTPGEIDDAEGDWLANMLEKYGSENQAEKHLLAQIKKNAQKIGGRLSLIRFFA